ncbi:hypothetical protein ONE63_010043 [Megalurothrips usitatus]|uniref:Uncharacterized protein n=1 Tax=Megalurothrips usitatus TaxID=439358 RepID=A0AAV7XK30_9NEOP|nr:hypothetical protein ONE63_010043 [Megalurothrips usitatus]
MACVLSPGCALLALTMCSLLLADGSAAQTFTWTRSWKPGGKRSTPTPAPVVAAAPDTDAVPGVYVMDPGREHQARDMFRAPSPTWRLAEVEPLPEPSAWHAEPYEQPVDQA